MFPPKGALYGPHYGSKFDMFLLCFYHVSSLFLMRFFGRNTVNCSVSSFKFALFLRRNCYCFSGRYFEFLRKKHTKFDRFLREKPSHFLFKKGSVSLEETCVKFWCVSSEETSQKQSRNVSKNWCFSGRNRAKII